MCQSFGVCGFGCFCFAFFALFFISSLVFQTNFVLQWQKPWTTTSCVCLGLTLTCHASGGCLWRRLSTPYAIVSSPPCSWPCLSSSPSLLSLSTRSARVCMVHHQLDPPPIGAGYQWCTVSLIGAGYQWCTVSLIGAGYQWCTVSLIGAGYQWCTVSLIGAGYQWCTVSLIGASYQWCTVSLTGANYQWWTWWRHTCMTVTGLYCPAYLPQSESLACTVQYICHNHWPILSSTYATITGLYCPVQLPQSQSLACTVQYMCHNYWPVLSSTSATITGLYICYNHNHWPALSSTSATITGLYCPVHLPQSLACTVQYICHNH